MKKNLFYYVCAIAFVFTISSCSVSEDDTVSIKQNPQYEVTTGYVGFMSSVDSLNSVYLSGITQNQTRAVGKYLRNNFAESIADNGGRLIGGYLGRNIGCVIGGITGSPIGAIGGYVVGRWAGRIVGSVVASYGASCLFNSLVNRNINDSDSFKITYYLPNDCETVDDSIGYYHNLVMSELAAHHEKYVDDNGNPDFELIYDDCVNILKENGIYTKDVSQDVNFKKEVISYAKDNYCLSNEFKCGNISDELFKTKLVEDVKSRGLSEEDIAVFSDYAMKITETCVELPLDSKIEYANGLNNVILSSSMDDEMKEELRSATNLMVNSSICSEELK